MSKVGFMKVKNISKKNMCVDNLTGSLFINDSNIPSHLHNIEVINRIGTRKITHVFHDVDGTHSLIRDWPPVMSRILSYAIKTGLKNSYDSLENIKRLITQVGTEPLYETDRFCVESTGFSALTQMEWAIRRGIEKGTVEIEGLKFTPEITRTNSEIIQKIWQGQEMFDDVPEPAKLKKYLKLHTPRLFKLYEKVLNGACRDRNLLMAKKAPEKWRVGGSLEFVKMLHNLGAVNYFVTGAVVCKQSNGSLEGGMYDEALAIGFEIGPGKMIEDICGSTWEQKIPKVDVMKKLCQSLKVDPCNILVVGDGRSEIYAGVKMGAVTISRLPSLHERQREIHKQIGTNIILTDFTHASCLITTDRI